MEIPATEATRADQLLTNTLPGTQVSSQSLQPSGDGKCEEDGGRGEDVQEGQNMWKMEFKEVFYV